MTSPPRIPKGSKEGGRFLPKWAVDLQTRQGNLAGRLEAVKQRLDERCGEFQEYQDAVRKCFGERDRTIAKLSERLGTSTPLIIWNIAVLILLVYLSAAHFAPGSVP